MYGLYQDEEFSITKQFRCSLDTLGEVVRGELTCERKELFLTLLSEYHSVGYGIDSVLAVLAESQKAQKKFQPFASKSGTNKSILSGAKGPPPSHPDPPGIFPEIIRSLFTRSSAFATIAHNIYGCPGKEVSSFVISITDT